MTILCFMGLHKLSTFMTNRYILGKPYLNSKWNTDITHKVTWVLFFIPYILKLYCRYIYTKPCMINCIWGLKTTMTSGEWTCFISFATAPLTCSERWGSEKFKMKIYVSSGIRTHTQSTTGKSQRLRPLGHEGLMGISGLMSYRIMGYNLTL